MASRDSVPPVLTTLLVLLVALLAYAQDQPYFDPSIPSCVKCQQDYPQLNSCAEASQVFKNFSDALWDPSGAYNAIKCACGDMFQRAYPLCLECFARTGQTNTAFNTPVPPTIDEIRSVCQTLSSLTGNASEYDRRGDAVGIDTANWLLSASFAVFTVLLAMAT